MGNGSGDELIAFLERRQLLTPFQIQKLKAGETTGFFAGPYKLLYLIAGGTFARVYRAIEPLSGQVVAVKILRERHASDPEAVKQFHREGRLTDHLSHPNITRTLAVSTDPTTGQHYIAMEFVEGGNLREFLKIRKKIDAAELVRLGMQMADGLRYALAQGVTHRDIKPTNILISAAGDIKWVDFGLGGVVEGTANASKSDQRAADYAGLERATGAAKGDPRSDIFFLGLVFFELITGEHPLGGQDRKARSRMLNSIPPLAHRDDVPTDVAAIIDKMVSYRPESRYQDYDAILADLKRVTLAPPAATLAAAGPGNPRVVIVHHSTKVQEILKGKLDRRGFQAVLTSDIVRAAALCRLKPAECIVIDLDTTGREGVDQYAAMKRTGAVKSAVFLVSDNQGSWLKGLEVDSIVQLGKPLILGPVYQSVRGLVERYRQIPGGAT
jgi:serine/threonine protein kinase